MDEYDPERKIKMIYDEWGTWHPVEPGKPRGGLYQQNTIRDACVAALTLDIFHNHADKVYMANIAQIINVLQAVLLVEGDKVIKTPTYHAFDLYRPHKGGQAVRLISASETITNGEASAEHCRNCYRDKQPFGLRGVQGSASIKNGVLCVTAVNSHPTERADLELELTSGRLDTVEIVTLSAGDIHAHNTFDNPNVVTLSAPQVQDVKSGNLRIDVAAGSVIRILGKIN
jgi:alpha-N-arabinofuranosidase